MKIYGAGLAGLIAAHMMRMQRPEIFERQDRLPDNHGALLRFRSKSTEVETGIKFKKVSVDKAVFTNGGLHNVFAPIPAMNAYSQKVSGGISSRSINDLKSVERFIAPDDFIHQLQDPLDIKFDSPLTLAKLIEHKKNNEPVISTIPMPQLMELVGWEKPEFNHKQIWSLVATIDSPSCEVYQTIYDADPDNSSYRMSITGNQLIIEFVDDPTGLPFDKLIESVLEEFFGIKNAKISLIEIKHQYYGKLSSIDEQARRSFIMAMTDQYGLYSVGRFATWRQLLLDDIINDVKVVQKFIGDKDSYLRSMSSRTVN